MVMYAGGRDEGLMMAGRKTAAALKPVLSIAPLTRNRVWNAKAPRAWRLCHVVVHCLECQEVSLGVRRVRAAIAWLVLLRLLVRAVRLIVALALAGLVLAVLRRPLTFGLSSPKYTPSPWYRAAEFLDSSPEGADGASGP